jgi:hypothetical protein
MKLLRWLACGPVGLWAIRGLFFLAGVILGIFFLWEYF